MLIVTNAILTGHLATLLNGVETEIRLFTNDYTPTVSSTEEDFADANFTGYNHMNIDETGWSFTTVNDESIATNSPVSWTSVSYTHLTLPTILLV